MGKSRKKGFFSFRNISLIILTVILVAVLIFFFISILGYRNGAVMVYEKNMTLNVGDYVGFNLDSDKLHFGTVTPGGNAYRQISLESGCDCYMYLMQDEVSKDWLFSQDGEMQLVTGVNEVVLYAQAPKDLPMGHYESVIRAFVYERKLNFIEKAMLKGVGVKEYVPIPEEKGGKIVLEIVNSTT